MKFETSIIPIWLINAEYKPPIDLTWLKDLNIQFIFDPNADFAKSETTQAGNNVSGVWAPYGINGSFCLGVTVIM